jgi:predicted metalloprotease with PDZ domain
VREIAEKARPNGARRGGQAVRLPRALLTAQIVFVASALSILPKASAAADAAPIYYEISLAHPERHLFHVLMKIPDVTGEVTVQMAAWNALYQIRDFSNHVQQVEARVGAERVPIEKIDKQTWRIKGSGTVQIEYATYWDEAGPFATQLNSDHAFINPAMALMYVPNRRSGSVRLTLPDVPSDWKVASSRLTGDWLPMGTAHQYLFDAANYDELVDAPIEAGKFAEFQIAGITPPISAVVHGDKWDQKRIQDILRRICVYELKLMEGAPYPRYTFFIHLGNRAGGGGMEHANSTTISARLEEELPNLAAHEFFHLWNVKRIRPASLDPVDYTKEQYTRALWFAEGVTSTYAAYTLVRTGLWGKGLFYEDLSEQISELEARPANQWQSAEQSSLDAWLEKYPLYRRPQDSVSYYTKGQVLGMLLDILIRDRTENEKSLDDVMRAMNEEFAKQNKPYRDSLDIRLTAEKVAGGSFEEFFEKYVAGAEPLPYEQVLARAGLELKIEEHRRPALGFGAGRDGAGPLVVRSVDPESNAAQSGLRINDVILSWNRAVPPTDLERWANSQKKGEMLRLVVRRDEKELTLEIRLGETTETSYRIAEGAQASQKARRIREGLLRGETQPVTVSSP